MYSAYINLIGKFLPGEPINNDEMEEYLGKIASRPSRVSQRILNSNGIQQRYYAIDKQQQRLYYNR
jgi:3-oxoacyl-[acyl-carrier-protein] synthase III